MTATATNPTVDFKLIEISQLRANKHNVRTDIGDVSELAESIRTQGLLQPLLVTPHPDIDGDYLVIGGHRRLAAAKIAGLLTLPCMVSANVNDLPTQLEAMLSENTHRSNLSVIEEADAYQQLLEFPGYTVERISQKTGRSASTVRRRLELKKIPTTAQEKLTTGEVTLDRALALAEFDEYPEIQEDLENAVSKHEFVWNSTLATAKEKKAWERDSPAAMKKMQELGFTVFSSWEEAEEAGYDRIIEDLGELPEDLEAILALHGGSFPLSAPVLDTHDMAILFASASMRVAWYGKPLSTAEDEEVEEVPAGPTPEQVAEQAAREKVKTALRIDRATAEKHLRELSRSAQKVKDTATPALAYHMAKSVYYADKYADYLGISLPEDIKEKDTVEFYFSAFLKFSVDQLAMVLILVSDMYGNSPLGRPFYRLYEIDAFDARSSYHRELMRHHEILEELYGMEETEGIRLAKEFWEPTLPDVDSDEVNF